MRLKKVSRYFDTCPVYDAYSGQALFKVQTANFMERSSEGSTATKRIISVDPSIVMPSHSCILALDQILIVGGSNPDEWGGAAIRKGYWVKLATDTMTLLTAGQAAEKSAGTPIFGSKKYSRGVANGGTDSELDPYWKIYVSANTQALRGYFLKSGSTLYRVRLEYNDLDGFKTLESDEVDEPNLYVSFTSGQRYDAISDSYAPSYITTTGVALDYSKVYTKISNTDVKSEQGDICMLISVNSITPKVGQQLAIQEGKFKGSWRILSSISEGDAWRLHIRRI